MVSVFQRQFAPKLPSSGLPPDLETQGSAFLVLDPATSPDMKSISAAPTVSRTDDILLGTDGADVLRGEHGSDQLFGLQGDDRLIGGAGPDRLHGGGGKDVLIGGFGTDRLSGGGGADMFVFRLVEGSEPGANLRDRIGDFGQDQGDIIDLEAMDADATLPGDQAFVLAGAAFTGHPGELIQVQDPNGWTILAADVNGDGQADFELALRGALHLIEADFLL